MADVDDEFLALVGGDESSDEEFNQAGNGDENGSRAGSESPLPDDTSRKAASTKGSKKKGQDHSDEEEEGEAYVIICPCSFFIVLFVVVLLLVQLSTSNLSVSKVGTCLLSDSSMAHNRYLPTCVSTYSPNKYPMLSGFPGFSSVRSLS